MNSALPRNLWEHGTYALNWTDMDSTYEVLGQDDGPSGEVTAGDIDRLWQHALHEDNGVLQRGNFFLVAESMLVVAFSGLLAVADTSQAAKVASAVIAAFGLLLTVVWTYVGHRHWKYVRFLQQVAFAQLPYYQSIRTARPRNPVSTTALMTWVVPALTGMAWVLLLFIV